MERFASFDGTTIAYRDEGAGRPVLLLHGFAADQHANWTQPHVVDALVDAGHRVLAPDARGHGASEKPTDPARYADDAMVRDARALLDHVGVDAVDVVGYSMGALVSLNPTVKKSHFSSRARFSSHVRFSTPGSLPPLNQTSGYRAGSRPMPPSLTDSAPPMPLISGSAFSRHRPA